MVIKVLKGWLDLNVQIRKTEDEILLGLFLEVVAHG
jgi:hypothetical protein